MRDRLQLSHSTRLAAVVAIVAVLIIGPSPVADRGIAVAQSGDDATFEFGPDLRRLEFGTAVAIDRNLIAVATGSTTTVSESHVYLYQGALDFPVAVLDINGLVDWVGLAGRTLVVVAGRSVWGFDATSAGWEQAWKQKLGRILATKLVGKDLYVAQPGKIQRLGDEPLELPLGCTTCMRDFDADPEHIAVSFIGTASSGGHPPGVTTFDKSGQVVARIPLPADALATGFGSAVAVSGGLVAVSDSVGHVQLFNTRTGLPAFGHAPADNPSNSLWLEEAIQVPHPALAGQDLVLASYCCATSVELDGQRLRVTTLMKAGPGWETLRQNLTPNELESLFGDALGELGELMSNLPLPVTWTYRIGGPRFFTQVDGRGAGLPGTTETLPQATDGGTTVTGRPAEDRTGAPRAGLAEVAGNACTSAEFFLSGVAGGPPGFVSLPGNGVTSVQVSVSPGNCLWNLQSTQGWLQFRASEDETVRTIRGVGNATLKLAVEANPTFTERFGRLNVRSGSGGGRALATVGIHQPQPVLITCAEETLRPSQGIFSAAGGRADIQVDTRPNEGCYWPVQNTNSWVLAAPAVGEGDGQVRILVSPNPDAGARSGQITIGRAVYTVSQAGAGQTTACGAVLEQPTRLTEDLDCSGMAAHTAALTLGDRVTLDLAGFAILGPGASGSTPDTVGVLVSGVGATIVDTAARTGARTARISGFDTGVLAADPELLRAAGAPRMRGFPGTSGPGASPAARTPATVALRDMRILGNTRGVQGIGSEVTITDSFILANVEHGVVVTYGRLTMSETWVADNGVGVEASSVDGVEVFQNNFRSNAGAGLLHVDSGHDSHIYRNVFTNNNGDATAGGSLGQLMLDDQQVGTVTVACNSFWDQEFEGLLAFDADPPSTTPRAAHGGIGIGVDTATASYVMIGNNFRTGDAGIYVYGGEAPLDVRLNNFHDVRFGMGARADSSENRTWTIEHNHVGSLVTPFAPAPGNTPTIIESNNNDPEITICPQYR